MGFLYILREVKIMNYIKEYLCDKRTPSDEEIQECLEIVNKEDCIVKLTWFVRYNG